jgi:uncharacterized membrane protein YgaE (UPF0421/DUF939 family)
MGALTDPVYLATKAAAAASVAVLVTQVLRVPDALSAGFVAVACVSPTAYAGLRSGAEQVAGSLLGGVVTSLLLQVLGAPSLRPLVVLLAVLGSVLLCFGLRLGRSYAVASFTAVYVAALPFASAAIAVETRLISLAIGVVAATIANLLVSRVFGARILERRMRLTRALVARVLAALPDRDTPATAALDGAFEPAFAVLAELHADLTAARRELLRREAAGRLADEHLAESMRLRTLLHLAKTLVLLGQPTAALGPALAVLQRGEVLPASLVDGALRALRGLS